MKKLLFTTSIIIISIVSCTNKKTIANINDYEVFLNKQFQEKQLKNNEAEINFWDKKLKEDTGSYVNMLEVGFNKQAHFKLTGNVNDLSFADSLFTTSLLKLNNKEASIYLALSQNAITQHKFKDAQTFLNKAEQIGADAGTINLVKFDINMELGNYLGAELCLQKIAKKEDNFDYLIRNAKFQDYKGDAVASIQTMEKAYTLVMKTNKKSTQNWVSTNLADMYSHSGRIKDAYNMYLVALKIDSANLYALKGIANICFVADKNTVESERILKFIISTTEAPDLYLNLAEISEWKGNEKEKDDYLNIFLSKIASNEKYGNMYNKYLIDVYLNDKNDVAKALEIAEGEMNNRSTPETYSWLALANYKANRVEEATQMINKYVLNKTFEPQALYAASLVLSTTNKVVSKKLKEDCKQSEFELGPVKYERLLKGI
jgi:lipopolysaccharide biosynthesis regulator YciM